MFKVREIARAGGGVCWLAQKHLGSTGCGKQRIVLCVESRSRPRICRHASLFHEPLALGRLPAQAAVDESGDKIRPVIRVHEVGEPKADCRLRFPLAVLGEEDRLLKWFEPEGDTNLLQV